MAGFTTVMTRGTEPTFVNSPTLNQTNPLIKQEYSEQILKVATEKSVVLQLAKTVNMGTRIKNMPVLGAKPDAYWLTAETGTGSYKQTTAAQWKNTQLIAEEVAAIVAIPLPVLADASVDLWAQIMPEVGEAIALKLDAAVLFGINKPASWPLDLTAGAVAAGNTVAAGTAVAPHDLGTDISNVISTVEADGFTPSGIALAQAMRGTLRTLRTSTGELIFQPGSPGISTATFGSSASSRKGEIWGLPAMTTLSGVFEVSLAGATGTYMVVADWDQVIVGIRQDMEVYYSRDGTLSDPATGLITFNAFQQDAMLGRFVARFAFAVPNPVTRLQPTEGNRYPAGVLRELA